MLKKIIAVAVITALTSASYAAEVASDNQKAAEQLATAIHMKERIDGLRMQAMAANEKQINQIVDQLQKSVPNISDKQVAEIRAAAQVFMGKISTSWTGEQATQIYTESLTTNLSAEQVKAATDFYASENGQKALVSISTAEQKMLTYITSSQEQVTAPAYAAFMEEMKKIIAAKPK